MMRIVSADIIPLRPQSLDESLLWPALDRESALFNALHHLVTVDECFLRLPDGLVGRLYTFVEDS